MRAALWGVLTGQVAADGGWGMRGAWSIMAGVVSLGLGVAGCFGPHTGERGPADPVHPVMGMLHTGIEQLDANIEGLTRQITDIQGLPAPHDPILQELVALDLAVWQLHRQQWVLQRDHLWFIRDRLLRKQAAADYRQLLAEWAEHEQRYETALEDLRQQRHTLEQKRVQVETRLIERSLR